MNLQNVPAEMKALKQWACYKTYYDAKRKNKSKTYTARLPDAMQNAMMQAPGQIMRRLSAITVKIACMDWPLH